jgi:hypothetical protein
MRFFQDETVISVISTMEPAQMVKHLNDPDSTITGSMFGHYLFNQDNIWIEMKDSDRPRTLMKCHLKITSTRHARQNKLTWGNLSCIDVSILSY